MSLSLKFLVNKVENKLVFLHGAKIRRIQLQASSRKLQAFREDALSVAHSALSGFGQIIPQKSLKMQ
jgi:hypothetical protein